MVINDVLENMCKSYRGKKINVLSVVEDWLKLFVRDNLKIQCIVIAECHVRFMVISQTHYSM